MATQHTGDDQNSTEYPNVIEDFERGCGSLDTDSTYLTADVGVGFGGIPSFVEFDQPIPYREGHFRTFKRINGTELLLEATQGEQALTGEIPENEIIDHIERAVSDVPGDSQAGGLKSMDAQDLLMHVGKSYYETPEEFVSEARVQGVSKKIPASENQEPPRVNSCRTRLFLIHPNAIPTGAGEDGEILYFDPDDEETAAKAKEHEFPLAEDTEGVAWDEQAFIPGLIGYSYLTRIIHTADVTGEQPEWTNEMANKRDDFEPVEIGEFVPRDDPAHPANGEDAGSVVEDALAESAVVEEGNDTSETPDAADEPVSASDEGGRFANREWSPEAQAVVDDVTEHFDGSVEEWFREEELAGLKHQDLRSVTSKLDLGSALGSNPSGDEMREMLARIPVFSHDDALHVDVDGTAYTVEELAEMREESGDEKLPAVHAKMAALKEDSS